MWYFCGSFFIDVANLVTTYLNMGEDKRSEEKRYQKRDFYKELEDLLEDTLNTKSKLGIT